MGIVNLHRMFNPKTIAVIGASPKKESIGHIILKNLITNGFTGNIIPVNPGHKTILEYPCYPDIRSTGAQVDLGIIATPIKRVPEIAEDCGKAGLAGIIIISSGGKETGVKGRQTEEKIFQAARKYDLRVIGPNCIGCINMLKSMNASFFHVSPLSGHIAFLSQSGAVCTSVLDMANREKVGFSHFVSLGSMIDVDFADMIDYLGALSSVKSIVMYVEHIPNIRNFMSSARAVSRVKPIIALKSGRSQAGAKAAASHTGALVGNDAVYETAFARAGILRVNEFSELLDCTAFLAVIGQPKGPGLVIITNAGGPGVMAADALESQGVSPAILRPETINALDSILPENWSRGNPVDILGDTSVKEYIQALKICADAPETDALLLLCSPAGTMDTAKMAAAVIAEAGQIKIPLFTAWIGGENVAAARQSFSEAGIATFDTPERAVRAFINLYRYSRNLEALMEIPVRTDQKLIIDRPKAKTIISRALADGSRVLTEIQAKQLLRAYGIPVNDTRLADSEAMAVRISEQIGYPVVLKICSQQILHKSDSEGIMMDLKNAGQVKKAYQRIIQNAGQYFPDARIEGVTVQSFAGRADYELLIGAKTEPEFGPIVVFGKGGVLTEVYADTAMGLPPLNRILARQMIERTKISKVLNGYRNFDPVNPFYLEELLIRVSRLVTDFSHITELDINPLIVKNGKVTAVDARVLIRPPKIFSPMHLIISSYPWQYEKTERTVSGESFFMRPIRPSDADMLLDHFHSLSPRSVYLRFFSPVRELSDTMLIKLTQIDYDREIALVALMGEGKDKKIVGVCRIIMGPDKNLGEFALAISDKWQGKGIGSALLSQCLKAAQSKSVKKVMGIVLAENTQMLMLGRKMGFTLTSLRGSGEFELTIDFNAMHTN